MGEQPAPCREAEKESTAEVGLSGTEKESTAEVGLSGTEKESPYVPEEWSEAASSVASDASPSSPPVALICGPKNSGKTTFSRVVLLQALLQRYKRVAYLDTDVGQPEFSTPGLLSLTVLDKSILESDLSIPFVKTPERCLFFGDVSAKRDPEAYLRCIFTLYDYYCLYYGASSKRRSRRKARLPLVVNTPGWVKGIGYDMLVEILRYISPTHVIKINVSARHKNLPAGAFWLRSSDDGEISLIEIKSAFQNWSNGLALIQKKDAQILRDTRIIGYFRQCISDNDVNTFKEIAKALAFHIPYEVPISSIKIKHLHCQVPSSDVYYSLNASIVGLAVSSEEFEDLPLCVGLGIVRGIDTHNGVLYVITPVPINILEKVDIFLQGYIQLPECLFQVKGLKSPYMSANVLTTS